MEIRFDIQYNQLLRLINQLSAQEMAQLKTEVDKLLAEKVESQSKSDLINLLVDGPVMIDQQYAEYDQNRTSFNQRRATNFARYFRANRIFS